MNDTRTMYLAEPYVEADLGSLGKASGMLIRQHQFPHVYDRQLDKITAADHDRCFMWDYDHARRCFTEHTGTGEMEFARWAQSQTPDKVLAFLRDILKADPSVTWNGFRVLGTINRDSGYAVWTLELFAKHLRSQTQLYSGRSAPNVREPEPEVDATGQVFVRRAGRW